jgi:hypothetical protein
MQNNFPQPLFAPAGQNGMQVGTGVCVLFDACNCNFLLWTSRESMKRTSSDAHIRSLFARWMISI